MRPDTRITRKATRREARHEAEYRHRPTRRQLEQQLAAETEAMLARQAHIDEAWTLPVLLLGMPGVTITTLGDTAPAYDQSALLQRCANCGTATEPLPVMVIDWRTDRLCQPCADSYYWSPDLWDREPATGTLHGRVLYRHK